MVRKRSRAASRRNRKIYESDENESETDLDLDSPPSSPAPKRYGLRQRKQPIFFQDFDYEDEDELIANSHNSEDEEYNVEVDLSEAKENHVNHTGNNYPQRNSTHASEVTVSIIEPGEEEVPAEDGLIDFEDVIRADVVVNKQRVDYENVIDKTEIQHIDLTKPTKEKGRRGRRPKSKQPTSETDTAGEGSCSSFAQNPSEEDTKFEVQIDPLNFVPCDSEESNPSRSNGVSLERNVGNAGSPDSKVKTHNTLTKNGLPEIKLAPSAVDNIEKYVPPELDEKEKEVILSNEYLLGNSFDMSADEFLEKQAHKTEEVEEEEEIVPFINFDDDISSDDDVVIIEKKPEVIVLDDD